jgi:hypothetical protein
MAKAKVKVGIRGLSTTQLVALARNVVTNSTGKATLPGVQAELPGLTTAANDAETAEQDQTAKQQVAQTATSTAHDKVVILVDKVNRAGAKVDLDADGNPTIILESGFAVAGTPTPAGPMPQVPGLAATSGDLGSTADLVWQPVANNHGYIIDATTTPTNAASWQRVANSSASKVTVTGLTAGTKYFFRVAALGTGGVPGPFSDPATALAAAD